MLARSIAVALLLLVCAVPTGSAAEPAGATVVLQLPPSMSPEAVKGLLADLAAKGAKPVAEPTADPGSPLTTADLAAQAWEGSKRALHALPVLRQVPQVWLQRVAAEGGAASAAIGFWIVALAGLVAAPLIGRVFRALADHRQTRVLEPGLAPRLRVASIRFAAAAASLACFGILFWAALLWLSSGRLILEETADALVWAALKWRLLIIPLVIVVSPYRSDIRLLAIDDSDARICSRWLAVYLAINPFNVLLIWLLERLGFAREAVFGAAFALGVVITAYKVAMF
jgi:hypothetical protein